MVYITEYARNTLQYDFYSQQATNMQRALKLIRAATKPIVVDMSTIDQSGVGKSERQKNNDSNNANQSTANQNTQGEITYNGRIPDEKSVKAGGFPFPAVFKMIPIGINILAKGPTLAQGFGELMTATASAISNTIILSLDLFTSTFDFSIQGFKMGFVLLFCMIENMKNMNICIIFYIIDLILLLVFLFISSILSILDEAIMKRMLNISLVAMLYSVYGPITKFDDFVHSKSGIHLIRYPDSIIKKCYTCSIKPDMPQFKSSGSTLLKVVTSEAPKMIGEPLGEYYRGFGKLFSIFNL